jgi:hypothetical protein
MTDPALHTSEVPGAVLTYDVRPNDCDSGARSAEAKLAATAQ